MPAPPYPIPESQHLQLHLLRLALRKAGHSDAVELVAPQTWRRQLRELQDGQIDVAPLPATALSAAGAEGLRRVDLPLRRGLLGLRRLVGLASRAAALGQVETLAQLQRNFTLGYGSDWADLDLLRKLGFKLKTAASLPELYALLRSGQVDYLSRGLSELGTEMSSFGAGRPELATVPGLLLQYPLDDCYYVTSKRPELHEAIAEGLRRAQRDGSHAALLQQHYGDDLARLRGARVLRVDAYPLPPGLQAEQFNGWQELAKPVAAPRKATLRLTVAAGQSPDDPRFRYATQLLSLALEKAGLEAELMPRGGLTQGRQIKELQLGGLDVGQLPALGQPQPGQPLPVLFPIRRGLLGVRLLLARSDKAAEIAACPDLATLQAGFRLGHGADWGDLPMMRQAGFKVVTGTTYAGLFRMLETGRFDFMSRAVSEVWDELNQPQLAGSGDLVVVPGRALFYPLDDFFWVNPARPELARAIGLGLERARADGSFETLYRQQYGEALRRAELRRRTVWTLEGITPPLGSDLKLYDALTRFTQQSATEPWEPEGLAG